jgi:predicted nucleotidyltransferase
MDIKIIMQEFNSFLVNLYKDDLVKTTLFGSWARGEETDSSDIDILVVIKGEIIPGREIDKMVDLITEMNMKYDVLLSVIPVSEKDYDELQLPLFKNIKSEGIIIE